MSLTKTESAVRTVVAVSCDLRAGANASGAPAGAAKQTTNRKERISGLVYLASAASLLVHFSVSDRYGPFRDELYYIACGHHLAFGYIDQPPFVAVVARVSALLFGNTLPGFRFLPALALAYLVLLTAWLTRELGGGRLAQTVSAVTVALAPLYVAFGSFLSMNAFEPLFWVGCACILVRILHRGNDRLWLAFGALAGVGLQNKNTMLVFGFGLVLGLIISGSWKHIRSKWFWFGGALALLIFLPNLMWQFQHGWPQIEVVRNCQRLKNSHEGPLRFMADQAFFLNPVVAPLLGSGLVWLLISKRGKRFQCFGWAYLLVIVVVLMLNGKSYYPAPFYPILCAGGAVSLQRLKPLLQRV